MTCPYLLAIYREPENLKSSIPVAQVGTLILALMDPFPRGALRQGQGN